MSIVEQTSRRRRGRERTGDPVIAQVMSENDIDPYDVSHARERDSFDPDNPQSIRGSERYILVRGYARHQHHESPTGCSRWWASAHSWCVIDLKKQKIIHSYGQDCKKCGGKSTPSFEEEAKRRMAEYACRTHLYRTGRLRGGHRSFPNMTDLSGVREGHHDMLRCDMCKLLGHSCQSQGVADVRRPSTPSPPSSPESDSPVEVFDPTLMLGCSFCGGTGHSYLSCSVRRHQQELEERHLATRRTQAADVRRPQPATPTQNQPPVSSASQSVETSNHRTHSATASSTSDRRGTSVSSPSEVQTQTATARLSDLRRMLCCSFCGGTGHSSSSCWVRRHQMESAKTASKHTQLTSYTEDDQPQPKTLTVAVSPTNQTSATAFSTSGMSGPSVPEVQLQKTTARLSDPTRMLDCSFCGGAGHSYSSCSVRRHQLESLQKHLTDYRHTQPPSYTEVDQPHTQPPSYTEVDQPQPTLTPSQASQPAVSPTNQSVQTSSPRTPSATASGTSSRRLNVPNPGEFQLQATAKLGVAVVRSAVAKVGSFLFKRRSGQS